MYSAAMTDLKLQQANNVVGKHLLVCCSHNERSKVFGPFIRPVLLTLDLIVFFEVSYHGNSVYIFLPDHPPKVYNSFFKWACIINVFNESIIYMNQNKPGLNTV